MKLIYLSILLSMSISCCTSKQHTYSNIDNSNSKQQLNKETDFKILYSSAYGGNEESGYLIIENKIDLQSEIERLNITNEFYNEDIDFKNNVILVLHLGQKNTGGYGITIDKLEKINDEIVIYTNFISPEKGENVTMALTNPYCIAIIPKAKKYSLK